jgi:hypothetical protein
MTEQVPWARARRQVEEQASAARPKPVRDPTRVRVRGGGPAKAWEPAGVPAGAEVPVAAVVVCREQAAILIRSE